MARGWESKAIESQQDAAAERAPKAPGRSPGEARRQSERATLLLARARAVADLNAASASAYRAMLQAAIEDLDRRLAALDAT
jgi:hypothetical protein